VSGAADHFARLAGPLLGLLDRPARAVQRRYGTTGMAWLFLLPNILVFGLFSFTPAALNFWISFTGGTEQALALRPFVGLGNYAEIFACGSILEPRTCGVAGFGFWGAMGNTLVFALIQVPVMTAVSLATALVLNREIRARGFWRAMAFYPVMLSPVVVSIIWDWILKRRGILNASLTDLAMWRNQMADWSGTSAAYVALVLAVAGLALLASRARAVRLAILGGAVVAIALVDPAAALRTEPWRPINWLVTTESGWPMFWVVFVYTWSHLGFYALILLAGLQAIPRDVYEAATMDGTRPLRVFWRIQLPLLTPTLLVVLVLSLIRAFQVFDEVYVLTGGGPGDATRFMIQQIYETAFTGEQKLYGRAAAYSVLLALVIGVLTMAQIWLSRGQAEGRR
jgi:ABC-type sugar transport system permease subunit